MSQTEAPIVNVDQATSWDGPDGDNWTEHEDFYNDCTNLISPHLFAAAAIAPSERVLDLGCGCGATTRQAARSAVSGTATGMDLSTRMLERAREHATAEGLTNTNFVRGDVQVYPFEPGSFDIAISRYGVMFFNDPVAAFENVATALRPGGRIAMLVWREMSRNDWVMGTLKALVPEREIPDPPMDVPSPFAFGNAERTTEILTSAGYENVQLEAVEEPMFMGSDAEWSYTFASKLGLVTGVLKDFDENQRAAALERLRAAHGERETPDGVLFGASSWVIQATTPG